MSSPFKFFVVLTSDYWQYVKGTELAIILIPDSAK